MGLRGRIGGAMRNEKLYNMISILYEMEVNIYTLDRCIVQLNQQIDVLGIKKSIEKPSINYDDLSTRSVDGIFWIIGMILGFVIVLFQGCARYSGGGIFSSINSLFMTVIEGGIVAFIGALIGFGIDRIYIQAKVQKIQREERARREEIYHRNMEKYQKDVQQDKERMAKEIEKRSFLQSELEVLENQRKEEENKLKCLYDIAGILPEYRSLIHIGYMKDLMEIGVSARFDGTDGLYYLVRKEIQADQLNKNISDISGKLDEVIKIGNRLYGKMQSMQVEARNLSNQILEEGERSRIMQNATINMLHGISNHTEGIAQNTAAVRYRLERIEKERNYEQYFKEIRESLPE